MENALLVKQIYLESAKYKKKIGETYQILLESGFLPHCLIGLLRINFLTLHRLKEVILDKIPEYLTDNPHNIKIIQLKDIKTCYS
ncbi:MAG: hypothetical protein ABSD71_02550 [Bacteroidales bacterium]|jgi:hypothetical protein